MKFHLHQSDQAYQINGVEADAVRINHQRITQPVIVSEQAMLLDWFSGPWSQLDAHALSAVIDFAPEVVLLGTGDKQRFVHPKHLQALAAQQIAVECMTTAAACRTFNILAAEGRKVVAALLLEAHITSDSAS